MVADIEVFPKHRTPRSFMRSGKLMEVASELKQEAPAKSLENLASYARGETDRLSLKQFHAAKEWINRVDLRFLRSASATAADFNDNKRPQMAIDFINGLDAKEGLAFEPIKHPLETTNSVMGYSKDKRYEISMGLRLKDSKAGFKDENTEVWACALMDTKTHDQYRSQNLDFSALNPSLRSKIVNALAQENAAVSN